MKQMRPVHPGDILARDFMASMGLSSCKLAKNLGVSVPTVDLIVRRHRAVTAEMALRLSRYFSITPHVWQNLQNQCDLEVASRKIGKTVARVIQPLARLELAEHTDCVCRQNVTMPRKRALTIEVAAGKLHPIDPAPQSDTPEPLRADLGERDRP